MNESLLLGQVVIAFVLQAAVSLGLWMWGRWIARRHAAAFWRLAASAPLLALTLSLLGIGFSVVFLLRAFGAVASADPSMKATLLAKNISMAMNGAALFVLPSWLLYLGSLVAFAVGSLLRPTVVSRSAPAAPR